MAVDAGSLSRAPRAARALAAGVGAGVRPRLDAVDLLRGVVMALMLLDHTRDFFSATGFNPRDVHAPALFLTRWVTHFCAPVFIFLAGASAFLYGARGRSTAEVSRFLFTRGLFLIVLELTAVRLAWSFSVAPDFLVFQVIWALGISMVALALLVHLPRTVVATLALAVIAGHNLLDGIKAQDFGDAASMWKFLHESGPILIGQTRAIVAYPLLPWIAVMAAGWACGPVLLRDDASRRRWLLAAGLGLLALFAVLRAINGYGDPVPWAQQASFLATVLAFINAEKYPPSLAYLAMTLGPALLALAAFRNSPPVALKPLLDIGRVPLLFYVAHLFVLHALAVLWAEATIGDSAWLFGGLGIGSKPQNYGASLPMVYAIALATLFLLHPLCRKFAALKQRRKDGWLSYL